MNQEKDVAKKHASREPAGLFGRFRKLGERTSETVDQATGGRLRKGLDATKGKVSGTKDMVTGKKFQKQFEDFTDVVSTAVIGVHRDQRTVRDSLTQLEVQQTGIKLTLHQIQMEQGGIKETIGQMQADQEAVRETLGLVEAEQTRVRGTLSQVQTDGGEVRQALEQMQASLARLERRSTSPWWQFWNWRWI